MNRFSQKDIIRGSITDGLSLNRYLYCANDPVNFVDPSGMTWKSAFQKVAGAVRNTVQSVIADPIGTAAKAAIAAEMKVNPAYAQQIIKNGVKRLRRCSMIDKLSEALYGEMNLFRHTGFQSWKDTGCSQPEFMLEKKDKRMYKVMMLVNDHGLSFEEASQIIRY